MARASTAPDTDETPQESQNDDADEAEATTANKSDREALEALAPGTRTQVMITMPKELKIILLDKAEEKDMTLARYLREWIAGQLDFELPATIRTRAPKYATEAERVEAQKAKAKKRNALVKALLQKYRDGEIDLDDLDDDDEDDDE